MPLTIQVELLRRGRQPTQHENRGEKNQPGTGSVRGQVFMGRFGDPQRTDRVIRHRAHLRLNYVRIMHDEGRRVKVTGLGISSPLN